MSEYGHDEAMADLDRLPIPSGASEILRVAAYIERLERMAEWLAEQAADGDMPRYTVGVRSRRYTKDDWLKAAEEATDE